MNFLKEYSEVISIGVIVVGIVLIVELVAVEEQIRPLATVALDLRPLTEKLNKLGI